MDSSGVTWMVRVISPYLHILKAPTALCFATADQKPCIEYHRGIVACFFDINESTKEKKKRGEAQKSFAPSVYL